jgi:7-cyano-7-deazaguanine reductase
VTLATVPNQEPGVRLLVRHALPLPQCCPVSGNPQPGSEIRISYRVGACVLEVYRLQQYLQSYVGGHLDGTRELEAMVQRIARDCAAALGQRVWVRAFVVLHHGREELLADARPSA